MHIRLIAASAALAIALSGSIAWAQCCYGLVGGAPLPVIIMYFSPAVTYVAPVPQVAYYAPPMPYVVSARRTPRFIPPMRPTTCRPLGFTRAIIRMQCPAGAPFGAPRVYVRGEPVRNVIARLRRKQSRRRAHTRAGSG